MRKWRNVIEEALYVLEQQQRACGFCRWMAWPEEVCTCADSRHCADFVTSSAQACAHFAPTHCCATCRHSLGAGQCAVSLEQECRDGGFEAWEG